MADPHDPTAAGFVLPDAPVRLSGNEIEMLCLKAARGAGLPWGLAEEAGTAVRWLAARGIDGAAALLSALEAGGDTIALGAWISDTGRLPDGPEQSVVAPILLLPFVARTGAATLVWEAGEAGVTAGGVPAGDIAALAVTSRARLTFRAAAPRGAATSVEKSPSPATLAALDRLALRTTVPPSATSRADAGGVDD